MKGRRLGPLSSSSRKSIQVITILFIVLYLILQLTQIPVENSILNENEAGQQIS